MLSDHKPQNEGPFKSVHRLKVTNYMFLKKLDCLAGARYNYKAEIKANYGSGPGKLSKE